MQTTYKRSKPFQEPATQERVFAVVRSTWRDKQEYIKNVASVSKKISGGIRSKDGVRTGQRANSCDTSSNLAECESEVARHSLFKREYHAKKRNKIAKRKGGERLSQREGKRVLRNAKGVSL